MKALKLSLAALVLSAALHAETVFFSPNGKTFHTSDHCMSLSRSTVKLHADRADAEKHGLKPCGICNRTKKAPKTAKNSWAVAK